jgi:cytoskeleton protein RodZ
MSEFEPVPPSPVVGPGRMLLQLREERQLSVSDVAQHLKYGVKQIEALEAEEFGRLPGSTFIRGMVRNYAKLLEADPQLVLGALDRIYSPGEVSLDLRAKRIPFSQSRKRGTRTYLLLSVLVLIVAGVAYEWRAGAFPWARLVPIGSLPLQGTPAPVTVPPESGPSAAPTVAPAPKVKTPVAVTPAATQTPASSTAAPAPPPREGRIKLEFDGESWVEIREQDGKMLMSQLNSAGSRKVVVGHPPMSLVIGNAAAVRLSYNDVAVDLKPYVEIEVARLTLE